MKAAAYALLMLLLAAAMLAGYLQLPEPGAADSPAQTHVSADYVAGGTDAGGAANLVTAVLLNYRGLDTFGEVSVIFSALIAVLAVLAAASGDRARQDAASAEGETLPASPVVDFIVRLMAPFIATFAAFVMVSGAELPGGGFQGGVVLGAMLILLAVAVGRDRVDRMLRRGPLRWLRAAAPLTFTLVALLGLGMTGWWFGLPAAEPWRHLLLAALEVAIGVGGAAVLAGIFLALAGRSE
jgi:multicomponent Na+:H+ antiporter subunit B